MTSRIMHLSEAFGLTSLPGQSGKAVHLLIDMQSQYLAAIDPLARERLTTQINETLRQTGRQIAPVRVETMTNDDWFNEVTGRTPTPILCPADARQFPLGARFYKRESSGMIERPGWGLVKTDLAEALLREKVETLYLSGLYRSFCVWETALDAKSLGFKVVLIEDQMADPPVAGGAIADLAAAARDAGIDVIDSSGFRRRFARPDRAPEPEKSAPARWFGEGLVPLAA